jgi:hypothetical protein
MPESNPYHSEMAQLRQAVAKGDVPTTRELFETLWTSFQDDIEQERREAHAVLAKELLEADPPQIRNLVREFIAKWIDSAARRFLLKDIEDPEAYFKLLDYIVKREDVCDELAPAIGGEEALHILKAGRKSYWIDEAMKLARSNVTKKSGPKALIDSFLEKQRIPSYDGRDGFTEKYPVIGRDTLFAVRDETRWVSKTNYKKLAEIIGCIPEQLHPRELPFPQRKRKH